MLHLGIIFVISEDGSDILSSKLSSILFFESIKFIDFSVVIPILEQQKIELKSKVSRNVKKGECEEITHTLMVKDLQPRPFNGLHELLTEPPPAFYPLDCDNKLYHFQTIKQK